MTDDELLDLFATAAGAVRTALEPLVGPPRRARTDRPGQYALDVVADAAVLEVLAEAAVAVVSEESGRGGREGSAITVVVDPVDGSTNASRGIPYWSTSLCAVDADGPLAALVVNQATGVSTTAVRGGGAWRDGCRLAPSPVERVEDALVALSGRPARFLPWKQFRSLGSAALALCDLAAGALEGFVDASSAHAPWDYLGGLLACSEAGAVLVDVRGRPLVDLDPATRRQLVGAGPPALLEELRAAGAE